MASSNFEKYKSNKLIFLLTAIFVVNVALVIFLLSHFLYLMPPLTTATIWVYLASILVPPILSAFFYGNNRRHISWIKRSLFWISVLVAISVLACSFLFFAGPVLDNYTAVNCTALTHSGVVAEYSCVCQQEWIEGSPPQTQADCFLEGFVFSPFFQIKVQGEWEALP
jgi:hypothetical protein